MPRIRAPCLQLAKSTGSVAKIHYQGVVYDTLRTLWARSPLIAAGVAVALVLASVTLVLIGPRYTGQAVIQLNFIREEPATGTRILSTASVDATAVVDGAARIIRSPATANAVVMRLGLDNDPAFARESLSWRIFSSVRSLFGFEEIVPSNHDLAEEQLMRRITVTSDPRSYLISISVTGGDPQLAAKLANVVALEYLRGQLLQQVSDAYAAAEREMEEISAIYGVRHPVYQSEQTKLESLRLRLRALREEPFDEALASSVTGQLFVAARSSMVPSSPNIPLVLGVTAVVALGIATWVALQPWPKGPSRSRLALPLGWRNRLPRTEPAPAGSPNEPPRSDGQAVLSEGILNSVGKLWRRNHGGLQANGSLGSQNINDQEVGSPDHDRNGAGDAASISRPESG